MEHALTWNNYTTNKRITSITGRTWTNWIVIDNLASRMLATSWYAWINAFLIDACTILWTFWADNTFRSTVWRTANETRQAWANFMFADGTTLTIHTAGIRMAQCNSIVYFCGRIEKICWDKLSSDWRRRLGIKHCLLGGSLWQLVNGFPTKPFMQVHCGAWFETWQTAFWAQTPGHGSLHLLFTQANWLGQSLFETHWGRQPPYGSPT